MELCLHDCINLSWAPKTHSWVEQPQKRSVVMFHFLRETGQRHPQQTDPLCPGSGRIADSNRKLSCSLGKQWLKNNFFHIPGGCWGSWIPCRWESRVDLAWASTRCEVWCGGHENASHTPLDRGRIIDQGSKCCTLKSTVCLVLRLCLAWAAPAKDGVARILRWDHSWEMWDSADSWL